MTEQRARSREQKARSRSLLPAPCSVLLLATLTVFAMAPSLASTQQPTAQQVQQALQQQPGLGDMVRSRIAQSGLSAEQIRSRLSASGYPSTLLDAYLNATGPEAVPVPGSQELAALQALGLPALTNPALHYDTGLVRSARTAPSEVFGVDVFQRTTTQFLPLLAGPVPSDYKLGPGDNLVLIITGDVELAYSLPVTREGFLVIPQVGQVYVANLTLDQLRDVLYARLGRVYSGVRRGANASTRFDISVANVRANQVYVVGEVTQPGAYQISSLATAFTALYAAGGVTERANMRDIVVQRAGKTVATLDLYDYLLRGETRNDIRLETGDVIFVPVHGTRVDLAGAVVRPAVYELKRGQSLADLIQAAGGFRADAALKRLSVYRLLAPAERGPGSPPRAVIDVALAPLSPGERQTGSVPPGDPPLPVTMPTLALEDGDSVVVDAVRPLAGQYYVSIVGMVNKPGAYPWREGMTLRDLVLLARGPTVGASLNEAEIARLPGDRTGGQLATTERVPLDSTYLFERDSLGRYVGPPGVPFPAKGTPEGPLKPYRHVLVLRQPGVHLHRLVSVTGQVRFPGTYSLRTKTDRLADVIARSGGRTRQADALRGP